MTLVVRRRHGSSNPIGRASSSEFYAHTVSRDTLQRLSNSPCTPFGVAGIHRSQNRLAHQCWATDMIHRDGNRKCGGRNPATAMP